MLVFESEDVIFVGELEQIEKLSTCLHHWERWRDCVIDEDGDPTIGVKTEEPFLFLVVRHDIAAIGISLKVSSEWNGRNGREWRYSTPWLCPIWFRKRLPALRA